MYADVHRMDQPRAFDMPYFVSAPNAMLRKGIKNNNTQSVLKELPTMKQNVPAEPVDMHRHWTMGMVHNHAFQTFLPKVPKKTRKTSIRTYEHGVDPAAKRQAKIERK